jgi:hypothetical protein
MTFLYVYQLCSGSYYVHCTSLVSCIVQCNSTRTFKRRLYSTDAVKGRIRSLTPSVHCLHISLYWSTPTAQHLYLYYCSAQEEFVATVIERVKGSVSTDQFFGGKSQSSVQNVPKDPRVTEAFHQCGSQYLGLLHGATATQLPPSKSTSVLSLSLQLTPLSVIASSRKITKPVVELKGKKFSGLATLTATSTATATGIKSSFRTAQIFHVICIR